ncbi:NUDIX hydrolase [Methylovirgula sp. 4M-Z18]|uniref:NUDIX hydrolase n=1 Tax=Methylovirgula sp. 4M-Z18 TaxID=2293567 RepID=UPI000E2EC7A8|nr:hypothetical protein [Methylovirgula sp. 4M-Z18]RFB76432.1 hypothetical protein DYH55_20025 [Methylovirgula sp. 4M-Z18]
MLTKTDLSVDLVAVLAAVTAGEPRVMTIGDGSALPSGDFGQGDRSLQSGLRTWVERQTGHPLGYIEQLYTFADRDRDGAGLGNRVISISYLGLTREAGAAREVGTRGDSEAGWRNWYEYFPWEDRRAGPPPFFESALMSPLRTWVGAAGNAAQRRGREERVAVTFGLDGAPWNEELILQRYELMYEAGLVSEAMRAGSGKGAATIPGRAMAGDHRRILATAIARLRAKIKYRPVVFELMPPTFTLLDLQRAVEALAGRLVHKPNFRRLIEQQELIEETGQTAAEKLGRPAKLYRFRREVLAERAVAGTKPPLTRA